METVGKDVEKMIYDYKEEIEENSTEGLYLLYLEGDLPIVLYKTFEEMELFNKNFKCAELTGHTTSAFEIYLLRCQKINFSLIESFSCW